MIHNKTNAEETNHTSTVGGICKKMFLKQRLTWLTKCHCFFSSFVRSCNLFPIFLNTSSLSLLYCFSLPLCYSCCNIFLLFFLSFFLHFTGYISCYFHILSPYILYYSFPVCFLSHSGCLGDFINNSSWCAITLSITSLGENLI